MALSIIIVNYNVKFFLEQCLCSVEKAIEKLEAEVIVVDNSSTDGSFDYLQPRFPWAKFILNKTNVGFSKANNLAIGEVKSKYVLFLNPDTLVAEDSFEKCISFMDSHPEAGAIGVAMIDGAGNYLKESKRGFPSPWASFCKLSGLTSLLPHSKLFAGYYLGYLSESETQIIDAISGAYMLVRKQALDKTGGFDEQFFMYAEDIDLSYRIQQCGYVNYYLSETTIIHFKGESTNKDLKHVTLFYKAMSLFVKKHLGGTRSTVFTASIQSAIGVRGMFSLLINLFKREKKRTSPNWQKVFLTGGEESKERLGRLLANKGIAITKTQNAADNIIFCEGGAFSFKKIIAAARRPRKKCNYKFHASNSSSVVGSNNKKLGGESIGLYP